NGWSYFAESSGWNFYDYIATTLLTTYRIYAREAKSPLVEGVSGNDPKAERGRGEKSPRWSAERRARHGRFARRAPRLTTGPLAPSPARQRYKMRPSALRPPFGSG